MKKTFIIAATLMVGACSYRGTYDGLHTSARYECYKVPPSEYNECIENTETSYEDYSRARKEALNDNGDNQSE